MLRPKLRPKSVEAQAAGWSRPPDMGYEVERGIASIADEEGIHPDLFRALIYKESTGNPKAESDRGAKGLGQLMPLITAEYNVEDPFDVEDNLRGSARYLKEMLQEFSGNMDMGLAAYNAGETKVREAGTVPDYRETKDYVKKINKMLPPDFEGPLTTGHGAPVRPRVRPGIPVQEGERTLFLRPFDPETMKPKGVAGIGDRVTEYLGTEYMPDGTIANIPRVWWDQDDNPHMMSVDESIWMAQLWEKERNLELPRYKTLEAGVEAARKRSDAGGASEKPLFVRPKQ